MTRIPGGGFTRPSLISADGQSLALKQQKWREPTSYYSWQSILFSGGDTTPLHFDGYVQSRVGSHMGQSLLTSGESQDVSASFQCVNCTGDGP